MASRAGKTRTESGPILRATFFGAFALATSEGAAITISNRRARALLAMLYLAPGEALERDYVSKLLWPGRFQAQARASLRQCLLSLDKLLTPLAGEVLDLSHGRIAIDRLDVRSDLADLETALAEGRVSDACGLLAGIGNKPLLDQTDVGKPFQAWLIAQRHHIESRLHIGIDRALAALERHGDAAGRSRLGDAWRACGRAPVLRQDHKARIAVLPFELLDPIGGPFFLAEGVVEELTFRLGTIPALAIVGRTSVMSVAGRERTLPDMASALNVSHLIEGNVHRFAEGIRVNLRLIDRRSGTDIWSDRYEGTLADAMGSRDVIGNHLVAGLCRPLNVDVEPVPARKMTRSREAYAMYLQGRDLTLRGGGRRGNRQGDGAPRTGAEDRS